MPTTRRLRAAQPATPALDAGIAAIRRELELPEGFPPEVEAAARAAAANPRLPALDRTDIPLVTIDPPGAMDLDQALHVERAGDGFVVHYAIADVAAFVRPGDPVDLEANRRGQTLYGANDKLPLHPKVLSEDGASLLPGVDRPAVLWTITLDRIGEGIDVDVRHAMVRSRERLDYAGVQRAIDAGEAGPMWDVLREVGELRIRREQRRGGIGEEQFASYFADHGGASVPRWRIRPTVFMPTRPPEFDLALLDGLVVGAEDGKGNCAGIGVLEYDQGEDILRMASPVREGVRNPVRR